MANIFMNRMSLKQIDRSFVLLMRGNVLCLTNDRPRDIIIKSFLTFWRCAHEANNRS